MIQIKSKWCWKELKLGDFFGKVGTRIHHMDCTKSSDPRTYFSVTTYSFFKMADAMSVEETKAFYDGMAKDY